jgi:hypothetical protein
MVEHLLGKHKALSSTPTAKKGPEQNKHAKISQNKILILKRDLKEHNV